MNIDFNVRFQIFFRWGHGHLLHIAYKRIFTRGQNIVVHLKTKATITPILTMSIWKHFWDGPQAVWLVELKMPCILYLVSLYYALYFYYKCNFVSSKDVDVL